MRFSVVLINSDGHYLMYMTSVTLISCLLVITMLTEIQNPNNLKKVGNANDLLESICAIFTESLQSENSVKTKDIKALTSKLDASHDRGVLKI